MAICGAWEGAKWTCSKARISGARSPAKKHNEKHQASTVMLSMKAMSAGMTVQADVVNFEGEQRRAPGSTRRPRRQSDAAPIAARQTRTQSSAPISKRQATSVRLSAEDEAILDAARGPMSRSHFIISAIRRQVLNDGGAQIPTSLGIADGVYAATVHDDVVALANHLVALEYVVLRLLGRLPQDRDAEHLRLLLADARQSIRIAAGSPADRGALSS
jgi:hypothetical protein